LQDYPRSRVQALAEADPKIAEEVREVAYETIGRLQRQLLVLGRVTALEKVCSFLLDMARRRPDERTDDILLPITRYDIADYLAMSVETVSRALTELQNRRVITLHSARLVRIIDRETLEDGCRQNDRW
jgi:CRP/FNR family nitrogen fixation transcriptional regulator